jgi:hypothetical protein
VDQRKWEDGAGKDESRFEGEHRRTSVQQGTAKPHGELGDQS